MFLCIHAVVSEWFCLMSKIHMVVLECKILLQFKIWCFVFVAWQALEIFAHFSWAS
jgi:hypothetical protein